MSSEIAFPLSNPQRAGLVAALSLVAAVTLGNRPLSAGVNAWTAIGPDGGGMTALAIDPSRPNVLYAGGLGTVFRSADSGDSWTRGGTGLAQQNVLALAVDPQHPQIVYAGLYQGGAAKSYDGGITWGPVNRGLQLPHTFQIVHSLAIDPLRPAIVYAGTSSFVQKTVNGGRTWVQMGRRADLAAVTQVLVDPAHPATVYAVAVRSGYAGIRKSLDGGISWSDRSEGLPNLGGDLSVQLQMAIDPVVPANLYLAIRRNGQAAGTWKSTDGAGSWTSVGPGSTPLAVGAGGGVFAGSSRSTDGGATWTTAGAIPEAVMLLAADPATAGRVYATTETAGIFRSVDGTATWQPSSRGLSASDPRALAIDPRAPGALYTTLPAVGVLRGPAWGAPGTGLPIDSTFAGFMPLAFDPTAMYAGWQNGFGKSLDGGATWQVVRGDPTGSCIGFSSLSADPFTPATLYGTGFAREDCTATASPTCPAFKTTDAGVTWHCLPIGDNQAAVIVPDPTRQGVLYTTSLTYFGPSARSAVQRSTDGGATWMRIDAGLRNAGRYFGALAIDPTDPDRLFVSAERGLYQTTNGGRSWFFSGRRLPVGPLPTVEVIVVDPHNPTNVYVGGEYGVFRSTDGGNRWSPLPGLPRFAPPLLILDPTNPDTLYVGTYGNGIQTYTVQLPRH